MKDEIQDAIDDLKILVLEIEHELNKTNDVKKINYLYRIGIKSRNQLIFHYRKFPQHHQELIESLRLCTRICLLAQSKKKRFVPYIDELDIDNSLRSLKVKIDENN